MSKRRAAGRSVKKAPKGTKPGLLRRLAKIGLIGTLTGVLLAAIGFVVVYQTIEIPDANAEFQTETTYVYYDGGREELGRFATQNRESIPLSEMPQQLQDAVVAIENRTFWTDRGLDPKGILRAAFSNAQGNATQGASTITQQYVKILYLTQERKLQRKIKEAFLSLKIHRQQSKSQILEGYLNTIYFGRGAYGVQAASRAYFNSDAKDLNLRQSAFLATVLNNPTRYDPANGEENRAAAKARYGRVLAAMAEMGTVEADKAEKAAKKLPKFPKVAKQSAYGGQKGHMLTMVRNELQRLGFSEQEIEGGGLRVTTTFTPAAMEAARTGVLEERPDGFGEDLHVGVASVETGTGAVRGFYGGHDYLDSQINWAVAGGQGGSTLKAFALAAAIKDGFSLRSTFDGNSPYRLPGGGEVGNQGHRSYGSRVSMVKATEDSINTAFIDMTLAMDEGAQKILRTMHAFGLPPAKPGKNSRPAFPATSPGLEANTGISLGSATVSPINLANAYATIANRGVYAEPYIIEKVVDRFGETRYTHKTKTKRAIDEDIAADVSYALQQVVRAGSGGAARGLGRPAAGKTGTATNGRDEVSSSWFVGYTPQMATAVMYVRGKGNEQLQGWLPEYFGGSYPARTWTTVMRSLMEGLPVEQFPAPAYVTGEEPKKGHEPYTPPPAPPAPKKKPKQESGKEKPKKDKGNQKPKKDKDRPVQPPAPPPSQPPIQTPTQTPSQTPPQQPDPDQQPPGDDDTEPQP